jgi:excisionase family DNA binding protein
MFKPNTPKNREPLASIPEVANHAGVSTRTVHRWTRSGKLPFRRAGHQIRMRWEDVDAFLTRD